MMMPNSSSEPFRAPMPTPTPVPAPDPEPVTPDSPDRPEELPSYEDEPPVKPIANRTQRGTQRVEAKRARYGEPRERVT